MRRTLLVLDVRLPGGHSEQFCYAAGKLVVELAVGVLGPPIKKPVGEADAAFAIANEGGAGVAGPTAVGRPAVEAYLIEIGAGTLKH